MANLKTVQIDSNSAEVPEVYTKAEVDALIASVQGISFQIVQSLPATGDPGTIYLLPSGGTYQQWVYTGGSWIQIGSVDMSNYYTKSEANTRFYPYSGGTIDGTTTWRQSDATANNHITVGSNVTTGSNYIDQYDSGYRTRVWPNTLSADRNIRYPDASGTLALTSDIVMPSYYTTGETTTFTGSGTSWQDATLTSLTLPAGIYMIGGYLRAQANQSGYYGLRLAYNPNSVTSLGIKFTNTARLDGGGTYKYLQVSGGIRFSASREIFPTVFQSNSAGDGINLTYAIWAIRLGDYA